MVLLVVPFYLDLFFLLLGVVAGLSFLYLFYLLIIKPSVLARIAMYSAPLEEGFVEEILVDKLERTLTVSIGQMDSNINTRMLGIVEDHLQIKFNKERDIEDYIITLSAKKPVFFKRPHTSGFEKIKGSETMDSRELIGYPALFRVAATVRENSPIQYLEFELSTKYFINQYGEERMKFFLKLLKIYPGMDKKSRNKKGIYAFGRLKVEHDE